MTESELANQGRPSSAAITAAEWIEIKRVFLAATALAGTERERFIETACAHSPAVEQRVRRMLEFDEARPDFAADPPAALGLSVHGSPDLRDVAREVDTPAMIGPYRVVRVLGEGSFGVVYLCEQDRPRRQVAVKTLRPGVIGRGLLRRFELEPEILARLRHPSIASVIVVGEVAAAPQGGTGQPYFVMEYVDGESILRFAAAKRLTTVERIELFLKVADGVEHAHAQGVIHRDIKPGHLLVTPEGFPRILDFGLARLAVADAHSSVHATVEGQVVGTLAYMSPEQASGPQSMVDTRSDLYSLGAVLYELLCGVPPIDLRGKLIHESIRLIVDSQPKKLSALCPECRGDLETVIHKALAKDKRHRYGSVSAFAEDLRRVLLRQPIMARSPSAGYYLKSLAQRHKPMVAVLALSAALVGGLVLWLAQARASEHRNYLMARRAADAMLNQVLERLGPLTGTYAMRRSIIRDLSEPVDKFSAAAPHDLDLRFNVARLREAEGDLAFEAGDLDNAGRLRLDAAFILDSLVERHPEHERWLAELAIVCAKVGDVLKQRGDVEATAHWYRRSLTLDTRLATLAPGVVEHADQLTWSILRLASHELASGATAAAERLLDQHDLACERLLVMDPDRTATLYAMVCGRAERAFAMANLGNPVRQIASLREAVALGDRLISAAPYDRGYIKQHALNSITLGRALCESGAVPESKLMLTRARPLVESLVRLDPHSSDSQGAIVSLLQGEGLCPDFDADPIRSIERLREAVEIARVRCERSPGDAVLAQEYKAAAAWLEASTQTHDASIRKPP